MKKAKLMLSALGLVAVLGSAFAFRAGNFNNHIVYTGTLGGKVCTVATPAREIQTTGTQNFAASTTSLSSNCPDAVVVTLENN